MKLNTKINLLSTLLTTIILVGSYTGIYFFYEKLALDTEFGQLQNHADELVMAVSTLETIDAVPAIFRAYLPSDGLIHVVGEQGNTLVRLQATSTAQKIDIQLDDSESYTTFEWNGLPTIAMNFPLIWPTNEIVTVQLVQPLPDIARNLSLLKWILIAMTLLAVIPIYLASLLLVRLIVKPVQQLTTTMQRNIQQNSYEQITVARSSKDEIAQMTLTYNQLMTQLANSFAKQQQFVGNASHELKTPLTVIESYAKLLKRRGVDNKEITEEAIDAIIQQSANMKSMMEQMLQLAKASEAVKMNWSSVQLADVLQEISNSLTQAYGTIVTIHGDAILTSDAEKLKQLLFIVLDNARKYSDKPIDVFITTDTQVHIAITDYGVGIPAEEIPYLFDRFYRVDKDRNRKTGGTGLGLAIAKQLADLLHATISIDSAVHRGTTVTISMSSGGDANA